MCLVRSSNFACRAEFAGLLGGFLVYFNSEKRRKKLASKYSSLAVDVVSQHGKCSIQPWSRKANRFAVGLLFSAQ